MVRSKKEVGAQRYVLRVGHCEDAGLGAEGWVVRMSDHFSECDTAQRYVKSEDYEALRLRFVKACERVCELQSGPPEIGWQPIETAPKGGKWILLAWPDVTDAPFVGYRVGDVWHAATGGDTWPGSMPTHWRPLPAMPLDPHGS